MFLNAYEVCTVHVYNFFEEKKTWKNKDCSTVFIWSQSNTALIYDHYVEINKQYIHLWI